MKQVDYKGLAILEFPDDWEDDRITTYLKENEAQANAFVSEQLRQKAAQETDFQEQVDFERGKAGFFETAGSRIGAAAAGAAQGVAAVGKMGGRMAELAPPAPAANVAGGFTRPVVTPDLQARYDKTASERATETPEAKARRVEANPAVQWGRSMMEDVGEAVPALPGDQNSFLTQVAQGVGTSVGGIAAGVATGPAGAMVSMWGAEADDAFDEEMNRQRQAGETPNPDKALLKSMGYGTIASAIEGGLGVGFLARRLQKAFGGTAKEAAKRAAEAGVLPKFIKGVAEATGAGYTEEASQRLAQDLIVQGKPNWQAINQEGLVGGFTQGLLDVPASAREAFRRQPTAAPLADTGSVLPGATETVDRMDEIITPPAALTAEDVASIEPGAVTGVGEAVAAANTPTEAIPVMRPGEASDTGTPIPEDPAALAEQIRLTADPASSKAATLITPGEEIPEELPEGLMQVKTPHGWVIFNPEKIGPEEVAAAGAGDRFDGTILGMADDGKAQTEGTHVVTTSTPEAKNVVTEVVPDAELTPKEILAGILSVADTKDQRIGVFLPEGTDLSKFGNIQFQGPVAVKVVPGGFVVFSPEKTDETAVAADFIGGEKFKEKYRLTSKRPNPAAAKVAVAAQSAAVPGGTTEVKPAIVVAKERQEAISEKPQPATPQQAPAGVVAPAPGGVVAPPVSISDETPEPVLATGPANETVGTAQGAPGSAAEPGLPAGETGGVRSPRPKPGDAGGKPSAKKGTSEQAEEVQKEEGLLKPEGAPTAAPASPKATTKKEPEDEDRGKQGQPMEGTPPVDAGKPTASGAGDVQGGKPGDVPGPEAPGSPSVGGQPEGRGDDRGRGVRDRDPVDTGSESGGGTGSQPTAVAGPEEGDSPVPVSADPVLNQDPPPEVPEPPKKKDRNHVLPRDQDWIPNGAKTRARANIAAIKLLKAIEEAGRNATSEEKEKLAQYVGWGAIPQAFDLAKQTAFENSGKGWYTSPDKLESAKKWRKDWGEIYDELKSILTPEEYQDAKESTINAHYTSRTVINGMWEIVRKSGFQGGRVLEPATGVGNIVGLIPQDLSERTKWNGSELDSITARLASKIYPEMQVQQTGFEKTKFKRAMFDLAISNVPFAKAGPTDPRYPKLSLHNYFFARALDLVKPGGLVVFITSDSTMDAPVSREAREYINQHADLVGAIRLPNDAFKDAAGTEVTTDIIVLRRRDATPFQGQEWLRTVDAKTHDGNPTIVNEYYDKHPEMLLGKLSIEGTMYGGGNQRALLPIPGANLEKQIAEAVGKLPAGYFGAQSIPGDVQAEPETENADAKLGQLAVRDGVVVQNVDGKWESPEWAKQPSAVKQAKEYIALRDVYLELIRLQNQEESSYEQIAAARARLNQLYDQYAGRHGRVNARASAWLEDDVDFYTVLAMEDPDTQSEKVGGKTVLKTVWKKAPIFDRRTIFPRTPPTRAENAKDAVSVSINFRGALDLAFVAELLGTDQATAQKRAIDEGAAFLNPKTGLLETPSTYLSGNVRKKLEEAKLAAEEDPEFATNVEALTKIQPPTIPIERIGVRLGAQWIPAGAIRDFANETLGVDLDVELVPGTGRWVVRGASGKDSADNMVKFGIHGWTGSDMIVAALNLKHPTVTKTEERTGSDGKSFSVEVKDVPRSLEAQEKQNVIKRLFTTWAKQSEKWAPEIQTQFNAAVNGSVWPRFDAATWTHFPGASTDVTLRQHQKEVVARMLQNSTLLAHAVGTGKTYAIITAAMEMRRIGTAKKPMIVVQNATLEQFARSFRRLYPSSRILVPNSKQRTSKHRNSIMSRIATGDWDAVIVPQSFVNLLPDDPVRESKYVQDRIAKLENNAIQAANSGGKNSPTVKELVKAVKKLKERLDDLQSRKKDQGLTFEQLGVDALFVDEAHAYKKLEFETQKENIKGLDKGASQRGLSMFMKVRWVQERNQGKNVIFATGTPVSNTIAESWTMMRFLRPDVLRENNIEEFDQFDTTFGESVVKWEMQPGGTYKQVERYAKFTNGVPLITMWRTVADVKTAADVNLPGIPAIKGGSRRSVAIPRTKNLEQFIGVLLNRLKVFEAMSGKARRLHSYIPVVAFGEAKKATLDMRLINPSLPDEPGSKLNRAVKEVLRIYKESRDVSGAQMVFSDSIEMEKDGAKFNAHQEIRRKLIEGGIPADKVVVIDAGIKDARRDQVFAQLNAGEIAVAIGSSERMGVGVNAQEHLIALHHLDAPHRPMDIEQREGRILRQGNSNPVVELLVYGVEKTLDSALFDRLLTKQKFINQILTGDLVGDEFEDAANEATMAFQEQMASFSGDPTVLEKFVLTNELAQLVDLKEGHNAQIRQSRSEIKRLEATGIPAVEREVIESTKQAEETERLFSSPPYKWSVNGTAMEQKEAIAAIDKILASFAVSARKRFEGVVLKNTWQTPSTLLTGHKITVSGKEVEIEVLFPVDSSGVLKSDGTAEFIYQLKGEKLNWNKFSSATGLAMCLRNRVDRDKARLQQAKDDLSARKRDLRQLQEFVKGAFPKEDEIIAKTKRLGEIERELQNRKPEPAPGETELRFGVTAEGQGFFFVAPTGVAPKSLGRRRMQAQRILAKQEKLAAEWEEIAALPDSVMPPGLHLDWIPSLQAAIKVLEEAMLEKAKTGEEERLATDPEDGSPATGSSEESIAKVRMVLTEDGIDADVVFEPDWTVPTLSGGTRRVVGTAATGSQPMRLNAAVLAGKTKAQIRAYIRHELVHPALATPWGVAQLTGWDLTPAQVARLQEDGYLQAPGESDAAYRIRLKDEFVAREAEADSSWWKRFVQRVKEALAKLGIRNLSNEEIARRILRNIRDRQAEAVTETPAVSRLATEEPPRGPGSEERPGRAGPVGGGRPKATDPERTLPTDDRGVPIQPGDRRRASSAEFGSPQYVLQKERERTLAAERFIDESTSLKDAIDRLNAVEDSALRAVIAAEVAARAAEHIRLPGRPGVLDPIDASRLVERATREVQALKTDSAQGLQAQKQINRRLGPFRAVLSYLELIRSNQQRRLATKFPKVVSENIRSWLRVSARQAVEAVAKAMQSPANVTTRKLREAARDAKIDWGSLFQSSWETQRQVQVGLYQALRQHPDLAKLTPDEVRELTNLFVEAWAKEHNAIFQREFRSKVKTAGVPDSDLQRLVKSLPRLIRYLNLGLLDDDRFLNAIAPEYGIGAVDDATVIRLSELAQEAQATPEGIRQNKVFQRMIEELWKTGGINPYDLARDFWFANILSGLRTWIDVGVGSWLSGLTMVGRAAADSTIRGKPRLAARMVAEFILATGEAIANGVDIIKTGDMTRLPGAQAKLWDLLSGKGGHDSLEAAKASGKGWKRLVGQMAYVRRIMTALDYVGSMGTRDALMAWVALSRGDTESLAAASARYDRQARKDALAQAEAEMPGAKRVDQRARAREILEEGIDREVRDAATVLGQVAALNAEPVGIGGILYKLIAQMPWLLRAPMGLAFARAAINMAQNASDWMPVFGAVNWGRSLISETDWFKNLPKPLQAFGLSVPPERRRLIAAAQIGGFVLTAALMGFADDDDDEFEITGTWTGMPPAKRSQLMSQGERPLSIRIGDTWISYRNTPFAAAMAFVGNIRDKKRFEAKKWDNEELANRMVTAWLMGALYIKDVSALSQFAQLIGASAYSTQDELKSGAKWAADTLGNFGAGFIPGVSAMREIDTMTDPGVYRPNAGVEYWLRNVPFARRSIGEGPAVNALGEEISNPRTPWSRWVSMEPDDEVWTALSYQASQGVFLPTVSKTATIIGRDGGRRQMNDSEFYAYQQAAGEAWRKALQQDPRFLRTAKPEVAQGWMKKRVEDIHSAARRKVRPTE